MVEDGEAGSAEVTVSSSVVHSINRIGIELSGIDKTASTLALIVLPSTGEGLCPVLKF